MPGAVRAILLNQQYVLRHNIVPEHHTSARSIQQIARAAVCTVPNRECKQVLNVGVFTGPAFVPDQD
jgi:hypothetical protein